jgi:hypothetical protein
MGFHFERLGYQSPLTMWSDFSESEEKQVAALVRFIKTDKRLYAAILSKDWHTIASIYNGAKYREIAAKIGREPYDKSMEKEYLLELRS